ncbi:MAG: hypothetical protein IKN47_01235 [Lachnospiraceae bacterium]|nr:hypothetical protein [Lachnospiraceae bacterium]
MGCFKEKKKPLGIITIICLILMASGPLCLAMPKEVFGIFERFSTYSAVVFTAILSVSFYRNTLS